MNQRDGQQISLSTVKRRLCAGGLNSRAPYRGPILNCEHRKNCLYGGQLDTNDGGWPSGWQVAGYDD